MICEPEQAPAICAVDPAAEDGDMSATVIMQATVNGWLILVNEAHESGASAEQMREFHRAIARRLERPV